MKRFLKKIGLTPKYRAMHKANYSFKFIQFSTLSISEQRSKNIFANFFKDFQPLLNFRK